ncbi:MAG: HAD family phosphatase [Clostridia bacterium]|nr:HAD family phosphatase [Clostridia bacterium]
MRNNSKKAFFFDFDGTIWFGRYGEKTLKALRQLHSDGHLLVYNSGRSKGNNPAERLKPIPFDAFLCGGCIAEVFGEEIFRKDLSKEMVEKSLKIERKYDLLNLYEGVVGVYKRRGILPKFNGEELDDTDVLLDVETYPISKFCIIKKVDENGEYLLAPESALKEYSQDFDIVEFKNYYEVTQKGTGKDVVCKLLIEKLGLKKENCYFFGDSLNDLSAFLIGGRNVAIGHSPNALKEKAEYVTTLEEDGVYEALVHFGFVEE